MQTALIAGATSSLATALCHELAHDGWELVLCGRDKNELEYLKQDLAIRYGAPAHTLLTDFASPNFSAQHLIEQAGEQVGEINALFMLVGEMGNQKHQEEAENIERVTLVNYTNPAKLCTAMGEEMQMRGQGTIVIVSSVAGDRGRQSNYIYGSAKAALTAAASGLRNKLAASNVHVMTVKPGFVDTPMTYGMESPLIADRTQVAQAILTAMKKKKNIIYVPFFWRFIMVIIQHIPEFIFKKLKL